MTCKRRTLFISIAVVLVAGVAVTVLWPHPQEARGCSYCEPVHRFSVSDILPFGGRRCTSSPKYSCIANLKQLDGAKATWALEHKKTDTEIPTFTDIFGTNAYIREEPVCPHNGTYTLRRVKDKPLCSHAGHTL